MMGKVFLLAFLCVSLTQVNGDSLENAIKRAIERVDGMSLGAEKRVEGALKDYNFKQDNMPKTADNFVEKLRRSQDQNKQTLQRVYNELETKAKETNKPPAVFDCLVVEEMVTVLKISDVAPKFSNDSARLIKTKMAALEVAVKPLETIENSLKEKYEAAVKSLQKAKNTLTVNRTLDNIRRQYDYLFSEIRRAQSQVSLAYNNFQRDISILFSNSNRQIQKVMSEGLRELKKCLYKRQNFIDEN